MAPETINLFLGHMFRMDKLSIAILLRPVDVTEKASFLGRNTFPFGDGKVALLTDKSRLEGFIVIETLPCYHNRFFRICVA